MRIGQFVIGFPSKRERIEVYGSERITYELCRELSNMNQIVDVFVPFKKTFTEILDGITIHFYKSLFSFQGYNFSFELFKDMMKHELDIVHAHNDSPAAMLAAARYSKKKKVPLVVTWHGDWLGANFLRKISLIFLKFFVNKVLSDAGAIIVPSKAYVEQSIYLKKFERKIVEIPHGIRIDAGQRNREKAKKELGLDGKVILYTGFLSEAKGVDLIIKSIPDVVERVKDARFVFVGGGNIAYWLDLAKSLGVENCVRFTGYVDEELKWRYYEAADIFVFASRSRHEVFAVVTLEAASMGLPMVVSPLKIFKDRIIDGYNGVYFNGTSSDLAQKIVYLLENERESEKIGKNARRDVELKYTSRIMAERTYRLYEELRGHDKRSES